MSTRNSIRVDVAIVGGGIAGLWLLNLLRMRGYNALLIERSAFGDGQTIRSQGMIHGGLKYALGGALSGASEAIAAMPDRWRKCLDGAGELDLRGVCVLSHCVHLWCANDSTLGRLGGFLASRALRGRVRRLERYAFPPPFHAPTFSGIVFELDELVIDTSSLLAHLSRAQAPHTLCGDVTTQNLIRGDGGRLAAIRLADIEIEASCFVLSAGAGNAALIDALATPGPGALPQMQRRPLNQVIVRGAQMPPLYGHCIEQLRSSEPRMTVTTHFDSRGHALWYLGGQLASHGVARGDDDHLEHARSELAACVPWIDLTGTRLESLRVDRAEPRQPDGRRPDEAFVAALGNLLICWPTKLALAPDLGDKVLAALTIPPARAQAEPGFVTRRTEVAEPPWNR